MSYLIIKLDSGSDLSIVQICALLLREQEVCHLCVMSQEYRQVLSMATRCLDHSACELNILFIKAMGVWNVLLWSAYYTLSKNVLTLVLCQIRKEPEEIADERRAMAKEANALRRKKMEEKNEGKAKMKGKNKPSRIHKKKQSNVVEAKKVSQSLSTGLTAFVYYL